MGPQRAEPRSQHKEVLGYKQRRTSVLWGTKEGGGGGGRKGLLLRRDGGV